MVYYRSTSTLFWIRAFKMLNNSHRKRSVGFQEVSQSRDFLTVISVQKLSSFYITAIELSLQLVILISIIRPLEQGL